jgi:hypothetical protein
MMIPLFFKTLLENSMMSLAKSFFPNGLHEKDLSLSILANYLWWILETKRLL